jgi:hypothetical protein
VWAITEGSRPALQIPGVGKGKIGLGFDGGPVGPKTGLCTQNAVEL